MPRIRSAIVGNTCRCGFHRWPPPVSPSAVHAHVVAAPPALVASRRLNCLAIHYLGCRWRNFSSRKPLFLRANPSLPDVRRPFCRSSRLHGSRLPAAHEPRGPGAQRRVVQIWVLLFATGGLAGNFVLSLTDHAVNGFFHRSEWIPVISSALAGGSFLVYLLGNPARSHSRWWVAVLVLQAIAGSTSFLFHLSGDLHGPFAEPF
jgi:hypothetical protein